MIDITRFEPPIVRSFKNVHFMGVDPDGTIKLIIGCRSQDWECFGMRPKRISGHTRMAYMKSLIFPGRLVSVDMHFQNGEMSPFPAPEVFHAVRRGVEVLRHEDRLYVTIRPVMRMRSIKTTFLLAEWCGYLGEHLGFPVSLTVRLMEVRSSAASAPCASG